MITTDTIFWTQIVSILTFVIALFVLYRLLVANKDANIQLLKDNISYLKDQLADLKAITPDILAQIHVDRIGSLEGELKRLNEDNSSSQDKIKEKEFELANERQQAEELNKQLFRARDLLKDTSCPYCGSQLSERASGSEIVEYDGREIDIDHEYSVFECGYQVVDGKVTGQCRTLNTTPVS